MPDPQPHLHICNQHLKAGDTPTDDFRRSVDAYRASQALALATTPYYMIMGDFNEVVRCIPVPSGFSDWSAQATL